MGTMKVATVVGLGTGFLLAACNALTGVNDLEVKEGTAATGGASGTGGSATGGTGGTNTGGTGGTGGGATGGTGGGTTGGAGGTDTGGTGGTGTGGTGGTDTGGTGGTDTGGTGGTGSCNDWQTECVGPMQIRTCQSGAWGPPETCPAGMTACVLDQCRQATVLRAAPRHTCVILQGNEIYCWGGNNNGQLGVGAYNDQYTTPQHVATPGVVDMALGLEHTCAIGTDTGVYCWGANYDGQIGIGASGSLETTPKKVPGLEGVTRVAAGIHFSCAYGKVGTSPGVYCWGKNEVGQLGTGEAGIGFNEVSPAKVIDLPSAEVVSLSAGDAHACAIFDNGEVYCWGFNAQSQLGTGSTNTFEHTPAKVNHAFVGTPLLDISAGGWHTCLRGNTIVECWGGNFAGQMGDGSTGSPSGIPVRAGDGDQHFLSVDAGGQHTCATNELANGLLCWGANTFGQLGTGDMDPRAFPTLVALPAGSGLFLVASGGEGGPISEAPPNGHTCVTTHAGPIYCWGHNNFGQLGNGETVKSSDPVQVVW